MDTTPAKTPAWYRAALAEVDSLMMAELGTPEGDRLNELATLVEAYERENLTMNLQELARVVPVHIHRGRRYFVRIEEIPDPWRRQFAEALRGSACPVLDGEGALAYAWDWEAWIEGRWVGRTPDIEVYRIGDLPDFDAAMYLDSEEAIAAYLADVSKANDAVLLAKAFDDVARARYRIRSSGRGSEVARPE